MADHFAWRARRDVENTVRSLALVSEDLDAVRRVLAEGATGVREDLGLIRLRRLRDDLKPVMRAAASLRAECGALTRSVGSLELPEGRDALSPRTPPAVSWSSSVSR